MATVRIILDRRYERKDLTYPILIEVSFHSLRIHLPTGIRVPPGAFSPTGGRNGMMWVTSGPHWQYFNSELRDTVCKYTDTLSVLEADPTIPRLTAAELRRRLLSGEPGKWNETPRLVATLTEYAETKRGRTREMYLSTAAKLRKYLKTDIPMESVNRAWLERFQTSELGYTSVNSVAIHLRNIRAAFNYALDNDRIKCYPFRKFKIRHEETKKRALTVEQLRDLATRPLEPFQERYRDLFMLMFYLCGINIIDMLALKEVTREGRVEYRRAKTHKLYSIKVEPEAMEIIKRYKGKKALLNVTDTSTYLQFSHRMNFSLKKVLPSAPRLSTYWARHTWATIAASLDIPKETISAALGHEYGSAVTSIYIDFDQRKVDEANRKVIDYVLNLQEGREPQPPC